MRRHLTEAQKATIAVEALPLYEAAARERQGRRTDLDTNPNLRQNFAEGWAAESAAEAAGTNKQYVKDAKRIKDDLPLVYELMREGELNIPAAREVEKILDTETQDAIVDELVAGTLKRHTTAKKDCYVDVPRMAPPRAAKHRECCRGHSAELTRKKMLKTDALRARGSSSQASAHPFCRGYAPYRAIVTLSAEYLTFS